MLKITTLFAVLSLLVFSSCEKEIILPETAQPTTEAIFGLNNPANPCGVTEYANYVTGSGTTLGNAEILNNSKDLYIQTELSHGWVITGIKAFAGKLSQMPLTAAGNPNVEAFPIKPYFSRNTNIASVRIPLQNLPACYDVCVFVQIAELDLFGNILNDDSVWLQGNAIGNGMTLPHCTHVCSAVNIVNISH